MANEPIDLASSVGEFLVYVDANGDTRIQVRLAEGTVWLSQRLIADLYQVTVPTVSEHLKNIYEEGELDPVSTIRKFRIVRTEGEREVARLIDHYALTAILAVGYRVRSNVGTHFRQWATARLNEYLIKGFVLDDERLKSADALGDDYFDELLERIREIRASERRFYQKITDIYAKCSVDYDPNAEVTRTFYATVQNKMHWAIHGHTAAELIRERADASRPNMGLSTWKRAPSGPILKTDATIAKNYLTAEELGELNRVVTMYLDYAEDQANRRRPMYMADWVTKLDQFLAFNERNVLKHAGTITQELARDHAEGQFERFTAQRRHLEASRPTSDFDHALERSQQLTSARSSSKRGSSKKR